MSRSLLPLLLAAVVCLIWWAFSVSAAPPVGPEAGSRAPDPDPLSVPGVAQAAPAAASAPLERNNVDVTPRDHAGREAPEDAVGKEVRIIDRETKEPVPNAEVRWVVYDDQAVMASSTLAWIRHREDPTLLTRESAWVTRSDIDGLARVFHHEGRTVVVARAGDRFGTTSLNRNSDDPTLVEIEPDLTLRVRVRNGRGEPVPGIAVGLVVDPPPKERLPLRGGTVRETDGDGIATFAHAQNWRRRSGAAADEDADRWLLGIHNAGVEVPPVTVDPNSLPSEPIELALPATGHLRIQTLLAGVPFGLPGPAGSAAYLTDGPGPGWAPMHRHREADAQGWLEFRDVGLGQKFWFGSGLSRTWSFEVDGPMFANETVERRVELGDHLAFLTAKLFDQAGLRVQEGSLVITFKRQDGDRIKDYRARDLQTGWVQVPMEPGTWLEEVASVELRWELPDQAARTILIPRKFAARGVNDLGVVQFREHPIVVQGRIEFDAGSEGVRKLVVERHEPAGPGEGRDRWRRQRDITCVVAHDGSFTGRGVLPPGRYRLNSFISHIGCEPTEFSPGQRGVVVRWRASRQLDIVCQVPDSMSDNQIWVDLMSESSGRISNAAWRQSDRPGSLVARLRSLSVGTYQVDLVLLGRNQPVLHTIPDFEVTAGETPMQLEVDLRPYLQEVSLEVDLAGGPAAGGIGMFCGEPPADTMWLGALVKSGRRVVTIGADVREFTFAGPGLRPVRVAPGNGEVRVTLQPWPTATVEVFGLEALPAWSQPRLRTQSASASGDEQRYWLPGSEGLVRDLLRGGGVEQPLEGGRAVVPVGEQPLSLVVSVATSRSGARVPVRELSLTEISAPGSYLVTVPPQEATRLLELIERNDK